MNRDCSELFIRYHCGEEEDIKVKDEVIRVYIDPLMNVHVCTSDDEERIIYHEGIREVWIA